MTGRDRIDWISYPYSINILILIGWSAAAIAEALRKSNAVGRLRIAESDRWLNALDFD